MRGGIEKCRLRVSTLVWWPGVSREMQTFVQQGGICRQQTSLSKEPVIPTPLPKHPWERVGTDLAMVQLEFNLTLAYSELACIYTICASICN